MQEPREKRRLKLMNEVLPTPAPIEARSARARTLSHMQRLLTVSAAGAAIAGCTKPDPAADAGASPDKGASTTTTTTTTASAPAATASEASPPPLPTASASAAPTVSASVAPSASAAPKWPPKRYPVPVVDPLPRPPPRDPQGGF